MGDYLSVQVRNNSDEPFVDAYNSKRTVIPAGETVPVPFDAACTWFGTPGLIDRDTAKDRSEEYARLRVRYGAYNDDAVWEANKPDVTILDYSGEELFFVINDPDGSKGSGLPTSSDPETMLKIIEAQQAQLEEMKRSLQRQPKQGSSTLGQVATDQSESAPRRPQTASARGRSTSEE